MTEYQCHEFVALDRPLTAKQVSDLRAISTRAQISPTRFWNEYHWGDLKADPAKLMRCGFDAYLYSANWGTRRLMLRMPKARVDVRSLARYFEDGEAVGLARTSDHVLLDLVSETEEHDHEDEDEATLDALVPLRAELLQGDLRPAYLAWLLAVDADCLEDDTEEPPVPAGLGELTAAQEAMVEFLRIDVDLVAAAALGSAPRTDDGGRFREWVAKLSAEDKDSWLKRAVDEPDLALGGELLEAFRATTKAEFSDARRTVGELRALAETQREEREKAESKRAKRAAAAAEAARQRRLTKLAGDVDGAWVELDALVEGKSYEKALSLAADLRDLASVSSTAADFAQRFKALRKARPRRRGFFDRWNREEI